jgi:beta-glucosidase
MSGHAIAEIISGRAEPVGRLPAPLLDGNRIVHSMGHGFGYSEFGLSDVTVELGVDRVIASAVLHNVGDREGTEIVQLYVRFAPNDTRSVFELAGFRRVALLPGESRRVLFDVGSAELGRFDENGRYFIEAGAYEFGLGLSEERASAVSIFIPQTVALAMANPRLASVSPAIFGDFSASTG